jgi:hypothetical protein
MKKRKNEKVVRDTILIVCGKTETEKNYFQGFKEKIRLTTGKVNIKVINKGASPLQIVQRAIDEKEAAEPYSPYRYIWVVFDKDDFDIQPAISLAISNGIRIAWSNEAFELWFIYHYEYFTSPMNRSNYKSKLDNYLNTEYNKTDPKIYQRLEKYMNVAIQNARKSYQWHLLHEHTPNSANSCTTVYQLVELLKDWM